MSLAENVAPMPERNPVEKSIRAVLDRQKAAHIKEGPAPAERRIDWLDRCIDLLVSHKTQIVEAMASDFGHRSHDQSLLTDVFGSIETLKFAKKHLRS